MRLSFHSIWGIVNVTKQDRKSRSLENNIKRISSILLLFSEPFQGDAKIARVWLKLTLPVDFQPQMVHKRCGGVEFKMRRKHQEEDEEEEEDDEEEDGDEEEDEHKDKEEDEEIEDKRKKKNNNNKRKKTNNKNKKLDVPSE